MLKAEGFITTIEIDDTLFKKQFHENMIKILKKVTKAWLIAATSRVPVWSGMALASLMDVSETVGGGLIVTPKTGVKSRVALGKSLGSVENKHGPRVYSVLIKTQVSHYILQDSINVGISPSAPWGSFPAGMAAASGVDIEILYPGLKIKKVAF